MRLRCLRTARNLSIAAVARAAGLTPDDVTDVELRRGLFWRASLGKVCAAVGCSETEAMADCPDDCRCRIEVPF